MKNLEILILYCSIIIYTCTESTIKDISFCITMISVIIGIIDTLLYLLSHLLYIIKLKIKKFYYAKVKLFKK